MSKANEIQVGGTHYRNGFQHWDLVAKYHLGYFEGQVSKYITRHRSKNGKQDVEKALHFLNKMIEVAQVPVIPWWKIFVRETWYYPQHDTVPNSVVASYARHNKLQYEEHVVVDCLCNWEQVNDLFIARGYILDILDDYKEIEELQKHTAQEIAMEADYDGSATGAYVNQDVRIEITPPGHNYSGVDPREQVRRYMEKNEHVNGPI